VTEADAPPYPVWMRIVLVPLFAALLLVLILIMLRNPITILLVTGFLAVGYFTNEKVNIRCNRQSLKVIVVRYGNTHEKVFPRDQVQEIRFAAVEVRKYGVTPGLILDCSGQRIKALRGIRSPDSVKVLDELQRLGYKVVRDSFAEQAFSR